jgi:hypothetical protein
MKLYVAGKVTGLPWQDVTMKFGAAEVALKQKGYQVVNPLAVVSHQHGITPKADRLLDTPWEWCMRWCIASLMSCDGIVMLPCWAGSRGAKFERFVAGSLGIPVYEGVKSVPVHVV